MIVIVLCVTSPSFCLATLRPTSYASIALELWLVRPVASFRISVKVFSG